MCCCSSLAIKIRRFSGGQSQAYKGRGKEPPPAGGGSAQGARQLVRYNECSAVGGSKCCQYGSLQVQVWHLRPAQEGSYLPSTDQRGVSALSPSLCALLASIEVTLLRIEPLLLCLDRSAVSLSRFWHKLSRIYLCARSRSILDTPDSPVLHVDWQASTRGGRRAP